MIVGRGIPCRVVLIYNINIYKININFIFSLGQLRSIERFRTVDTVGAVERDS